MVQAEPFEVEWSKGTLTGHKISLADNGAPDFQTWGGGLVAAIDYAIVFDRTGMFWMANPTKLVPLDLPKLDINRPKDPKYDNQSGVRLHRAVYSESTDTLYVSHEYFDEKLSLTRFRVSMLKNFSHYIEIKTSYIKKLNNLLLDSIASPRNKKWEPFFETEILEVENYFGAAGGGGLCLIGHKLFVAIGDYGQDGVLQSVGRFPAAQNKKTSFGKLFEVDINSRKKTLRAIGLRNPQGLTCNYDNVFSIGHGPQGGDEINIIPYVQEAIINFGWPFQTFGSHYGSLSWPLDGQGKGSYTAPLFSFVPSVGPSNLTLVSDDNILFNGNLLIGSMKARHLYRAVLSKNQDRVIMMEPIFIGERIRDLLVVQGKIYLLTDQANLIMFSIKDGGETDLATIHMNIDPCLSCHSYGANGNASTAPNLQKIFSRNIGSSAYAGYSDALLAMKDQNWTREMLERFLISPQEVVKGSNKPHLLNIGITKEQIIQALDALERMER